MNKPKINFEKIDKAFIEREFNIERVKQNDTLSRWVADNGDNEYPEQLDDYRLLFEDRMEDVNEETLKMNFISFVLNSVQFNGKNYTAFADERLEAEFDTMIVSGKADWFVAKGKYKPETPYFFLQEYKRTKRGNSDPDGQLLAEMLVVRKLNDDGQPMKGLTVLGKLWNFMVLDGGQYCISKSYDSTQKEDLKEIFRILKVAKNEIAAKFA